ncbi:hypothetical protein BRC81_17090 [Halobacteriales archaeon QS_1_68_20]|nr:MAG: hypothetical protein BRC81_17090 [Halobacteriales archaeon QS_1_68_20]
MSSETEGEWEGLSEAEIEALHEVQVGCEWLERAQGHLLAFHHAVGHGMDHFAVAEDLLREGSHPGLADDVRDEVLPRGVDGDRWSYGVVESFERTMLAEVRDLEAVVHEKLADGHRHVHERRQRKRWRERARE